MHGEQLSAYLRILPFRPVVSQAWGPVVSSKEQCLSGVSFFLLPLFLPFLNSFSAVGHVNSFMKANSWVGSHPWTRELATILVG